MIDIQWVVGVENLSKFDTYLCAMAKNATRELRKTPSKNSVTRDSVTKNGQKNRTTTYTLYLYI